MHYNCKMQLANVRKWQFSINKNFHNIYRRNKYCKINGKYNQSYIWKNSLAKFYCRFFQKHKLIPKIFLLRKTNTKKGNHVYRIQMENAISQDDLFFFMIRKTVSQHEWEILTVWFRKGEESTSFFACPISRFVRFFFYLTKEKLF